MSQNLQRILTPGPFPYAGTSSAMTSGTAYFSYIGYTEEERLLVTDLFVKQHSGSAGASVTGAEIGLFSTPAAPNNAGQTLTKLLAANLGSLTVADEQMVTQTGGALSYVVPLGIHLWIGVLITAGTMPRLSAADYNMPLGQDLSTASAAAFSGSGPWTGSLVAYAAAPPSNMFAVATVVDPWIAPRVSPGTFANLRR